MKRRRLIILISIPVVALSLGVLLAGWVLHSDGGARWLLTRVSNSFAGRLTIDNVAGNLGEGLRITEIRFTDGVEITVAQLKIEVGLTFFPLQVNVSSLHLMDLKIVAEASTVDSQDTPVTFEAPSLVTNAQGSIALTSPFVFHWSGNGKMEEPSVKSEFEFVIEGVADNYDLELQAVLETTGLPGINLALTGQGDLDGLTIDSFSAISDFLHSTASGTANWVGTPSIDLDVEVERFEPAIWISDWPPEQFIHGQVVLHMDDSRIALHEFGGKVAGTDITFDGSGELDLHAEIVEAALSWQNVRWPVDSDTYQLSSDIGILRISGSPANWHFNGSLELDTPEYPGGSFELEGSGATDSAEILIARGEALGGTLTGQANLYWGGALRWNAKLDVKQIDTSAIVPAWPARLDATLNITQNADDDSFVMQFDNLHAEFDRGYLDGSGGIQVYDSAVRFNAFRLHSGNSRISLDGGLGDPTGLEFELDINRPGWMADLLGAELRGHGRIALQTPQPVLDIDVIAHDLAWGDIRIESILITPGASKLAGDINLVMAATNLQLGTFNFQTADAIIAGDRNRQTLDLKLSAGKHDLAANFAGSLTDWQALADSAWEGQLTSLVLSSSKETLVSLQSPAPLTVAAGEIDLGRTCLEIVVSGGICVEFGWQANGQLDLKASLSSLPLAATQLVLDHEIEFTQTLDGEIRWIHSPGEGPSGNAAIRISAGHFGDERDEDERVATAEGFFGFKLVNGNLTAGEFDIPFPDIGQIDLDYAISGMALDGTGKLTGKVKVDLNDISVLEQFIPGMDQLGGQLNTNLQVSGSLLDPAFSGSVSLQNGTADIPIMGTQLRQVRLDGEISRSDKASLRGEFVAGDGRGEIIVETNFSDWLAPGMHMSLSGTNLRLFNTSELRMNADTDIQLAWSQGEWTIDGEVVVRQARIAPVTSVVSRVTESEDLQLVAGTLPFGESVQATAPVKLTGNLTVSLGDKVEINTEFARANLSGSVSLAWDGAVIPVATGSIHGDGTISVFGPSLHVQDGQLRFPGVPVTDPILEIRAERDVFGNTQVRTAGVSITGPLRRPVIEAYTNPLTTKDRAWALLITGSDIDYGRGVGAFEVGTYIAPRLYLSYGISLFDDDNVVSARYDLKRGFGVKASSGQRESGIDMSYTVDH